MPASPDIVAIIPARFASVRFPGKPLADATGKPLIRHVCEAAARSRRLSRIIVATDDLRIADAVRAFGGEVAMTRADHPNGTSRIAEVASAIDCDVVVNVQGDEPSIEPELIDGAIDALLARPACPMATIASPFGAHEDPADPNLVKVVLAADGTALYFSRSPIPAWRDRDRSLAADPAARAPAEALKHVGLYVYRRDFLVRFPTLPATPLERCEQLEQLRALEHGHRIAVAIGEAPFHGVDTPEQYEAFVRRYRATAGR